MKILLVDNAGVAGGAGRSMAELAAALAARGHEVAAALPEGGLAAMLRSSGIPVFAIPRFTLHRPLRFPFRLASDLARLLSARRAIRRAASAFAPDIVHANGLQPALATPSNPGKNGAPLFVHVRDLRFPAAAARFAARRAVRLIAISRAVEARLRETLPEGLRAKVALAPNGIDIDGLLARRLGKPDARRALGLPQDARIVGMMAHYAPWKRHDRFVEMAKALAGDTAAGPIAFAVAGGATGDDSGSIARLLRRAASDGPLRGRLHVLGDVDCAAFLSAIDCLVHPASVEPFGRCVCEAVAMDVPVVAVDSAGPAEILAGRDGATLVTDTAAAPSALAAAVLAALARPKTPSRPGSLAPFSIGRVADDILRLYGEAREP